MNATLRQLRPGESDPELLLLGASAGAVAWGGAWLASGLPLPRCLFHAVTGCPCPTCGATRCVMALLHGRVAEALSWNPLVFTGLVAILLFNLYAAATLLFRLPRLRLALTGQEGRFIRLAFGLIISANWLYEIHHRV
jgi:hypothetical protein